MMINKDELLKKIGTILANELKRWGSLTFEDWLAKRPTLSDPIRYDIKEDGIDYTVEVALLELEDDYVHPVVGVMTVLRRPRWRLFFPTTVHRSDDWIVNRVDR